MAEQVTCWGTALPPSTVDMSRRMGTPSPLPPNSLKYHRKQSSCGQTSLSCQQAIGFVKKKSSQARQTLSAFFSTAAAVPAFFQLLGLCARCASIKKPKQQVWLLTQFFLFPFSENSLICLEGKSMTPHRGNTILFRSSQPLPRFCLV